MPAEEPPISPEEITAALASRDLPALIARLVRERSFGAVALLFRHAAGPAAPPGLGIAELDAAARALVISLDAVPAKSARADELRVVRLTAADALLARGARPPLSDAERAAASRAAALLEAAGAHARAALVHEELGDDDAAAAAWGSAGELERMEAAHARQDLREGRRRAAADALRRFDVLLAGGDRRRALAALRDLAPDSADGLGTHARATAIEGRLVRGRGVTLRERGGASVRLAIAPARLGRDPAAEVVLRDAGVSRVHAKLDVGPRGPFIEDAGSRGGLLFAGARVEHRFELRGEGDLALGATAALRFSTSDAAHVVLRGTSGLDRDLVALVGAAPLDLGAAWPAARGLTLVAAGDGLRVERGGTSPLVRVGGHLIGVGCDLLHGDVVEVSGPPALVLEVL